MHSSSASAVATIMGRCAAAVPDRSLRAWLPARTVLAKTKALTRGPVPLITRKEKLSHQYKKIAQIWTLLPPENTVLIIKANLWRLDVDWK